MPTHICPKCIQTVNDSICCDRCNKWHHLNCTNISKYEFTAHTRNKYKEWKCDSCIDKYCNRCSKTFPGSNCDSICCDKCNCWYHLLCSALTTNEFKFYLTNKDKAWKCNSCLGKFCKKCDITLFKKENISCSICKNKYHQKCSGLTRDRFKNIKEKEDTWTCSFCYSNIFPFHQIDNNKLDKLRNSTSKNTP